MARYTGPKSKIARKFGEPIFGEDKVLAKKNFPRVSTARTSAARPLNMVFSFVKSRKLNIPMACLKSSSTTSLKRHHA